jgi:CO/xanthine dehydrogenase FAD-binding subunit
MKPPKLGYAAPGTVAEALELVGEAARPLAGGQSLVPLLNFRLARPEALVDLNGIRELAYLRRSAGTLRIGALARQATIERSRLVASGWPLLGRAVRYVAHPQIRSRGTVGGSVAHADPTAELPAALAALEARFHVRSRRGSRILSSSELFLGPLTTALEPDELLLEVEVPPLPGNAGTSFVEHARTHGDFAIAGVAAVVVPGEHAAIGLLGAGPTPARAPAAEAALVAGSDPGEVAELASGGIDDPWLRALLAALVRRALEEALEEARPT